MLLLKVLYRIELFAGKFCVNLFSTWPMSMSLISPILLKRLTVKHFFVLQAQYRSAVTAQTITSQGMPQAHFGGIAVPTNLQQKLLKKVMIFIKILYGRKILMKIVTIFNNFKAIASGLTMDSVKSFHVSAIT